MTLTIYTDGSSLVKDKTGGWAWWVSDDLCDSGYEQPATNNTMELMAVIRGLESCSCLGEDMLVVSDSMYVIGCLTDQWHIGWRNRARDGHWRTSLGKRVANQALWERLLTAVEECRVAGLQVTWQHCRGHGRGGPEDAPYVEGNKVVDYLAGAARKAGA